MRPTQAPPSADVLLTDPTIFTTLNREEQDRLYSAIAGLESFMRAHILVSRLSTQESAPPESDRAVPLKEAAKLLSMTPDFLYRNWHTLHGYRDKDSRIKFRLAYINHYLKEKEKGRR